MRCAACLRNFPRDPKTCLSPHAHTISLGGAQPTSMRMFSRRKIGYRNKHSQSHDEPHTKPTLRPRPEEV